MMKRNDNYEEWLNKLKGESLFILQRSKKIKVLIEVNIVNSWVMLLL